jgi:hypothetical protein
MGAVVKIDLDNMTYEGYSTRLKRGLLTIFRMRHAHSSAVEAGEILFE